MVPYKDTTAVSYTHLDVYKRQELLCTNNILTTIANNSLSIAKQKLPIN